MSHRICTLEAVQLVTHDSRVHYDGYKFCATKGPSHALIEIPQMNPELACTVAIFWIGRNPRCEVSMASASQTVRTALEGLIW